MDWFLHDGDICHKRVNNVFKSFKILTSTDIEWKKVPDFGSITCRTFFPKLDLIDFGSTEIYFTVGSNYAVCLLKLKISFMRLELILLILWQILYKDVLLNLLQC